LEGRKETGEYRVNRYYEGGVGWEDRGELRRDGKRKGKEEGQHTVHPVRDVN
jgi:hypothetical protein